MMVGLLLEDEGFVFFLVVPLNMMMKMKVLCCCCGYFFFSFCLKMKALLEYVKTNPVLISSY
jgi:hypothetical protein